MPKPIAYKIRPAIVVPVLLSLGAVLLAVTVTRWAMLALPFIVLGSMCAAPNHNLADGFLVIVASIAGLVIATFHQDIGSAIFEGSFFSWFLSCIEKRRRAVPIYEDIPPPDN